MRAWVAPPTVPPTAQALRAEVAATPLKIEARRGVGLGTRRHVTPFHRAM
jgi:hypothetical protein